MIRMTFLTLKIDCFWFPNRKIEIKNVTTVSDGESSSLPSSPSQSSKPTVKPSMERPDRAQSNYSHKTAISKNSKTSRVTSSRPQVVYWLTWPTRPTWLTWPTLPTLPTWPTWTTSPTWPSWPTWHIWPTWHTWPN